MFAKFERFLTPTATPEHPEPPGRPARLLVALCPAGEMAVRGLVRDRASDGAERQRGALVHGPRRHHGHESAGRPLFRRGLAVASRHDRYRAHRPSGRDARALSHQQPGAGGAVHRTGALAGALARGAAELGVLPERFCRPHFQSRDADRALGALDADRDHHHSLVHYRLRRFRDRANRLGRTLARGSDPAVVFGLRGAALFSRAADPRTLEGELHRPLRADRTHRRQLHQHPHRKALRSRPRRGSICSRRRRPPCRSVHRLAASADGFRRHARLAQRALDRRIGGAGAVAVALRQNRGRRHRHGAAADAAAHQHVTADRDADYGNLRGYRRGAGGHAEHRAPAATPRRGACTALDGEGRPHRIQEREIRLRPRGRRAGELQSDD